VVVQVDAIDVQTDGEWQKKTWSLLVDGWQAHQNDEQDHGEVKHWWRDETSLCLRETHEKALVERIGLFSWFWCVVFSSFITRHLL